MVQSKYDALLAKLLAWAAKTEPIRLVLQQGSYVNGGHIDEWSDLDICLFTAEPNALLEYDFWREFGVLKTWVADGFDLKGHRIETRLLIYENDCKLDLSFYPLSFLKHLQAPGPLPDDFNIGYQLLLDKDKLGSSLLPPTNSGFEVQLPDKAQQALCQREFIFECWHVDKYLARAEWYHALWRLGEARSWLLLALSWEIASQNDKSLIIKSLGQDLSKWLPERFQSRLQRTFPNATESSIREALTEMKTLFAQLFMH